MQSIFGLSAVTGGLYPGPFGGNLTLITGGLISSLPPQPGPFDSSPAIIAGQAASVLSSIIGQVGVPPGVNITGNANIASIGIPIGQINTQFDLSDIIQNPTSLTGQQIYNSNGVLTSQYENTITTYTGSDLRIIVDLVNTPTISGNPQPVKQLIECTTFTISTHREKAAVRASGFINPRGFARGRRTIAGTLVLTQFSVDILYNFLMNQQTMGSDVSKDSQYVKVDQLPPFNMTLLFADEFGNSSYQQVLGVDMVTDGIVYSSNDMLAERTISYMASDFTPLLNVGASALFSQAQVQQVLASERTVQSVLSGGSQFAIPSTNIFSPSS